MLVAGPVLWQALRPTRIWRIMPRMISSLRFGLRLLLGCLRPFMTASALYGQSRFCCIEHEAGLKTTGNEIRAGIMQEACGKCLQHVFNELRDTSDIGSGTTFQWGPTY